MERSLPLQNEEQAMLMNRSIYSVGADGLTTIMGLCYFDISIDEY